MLKLKKLLLSTTVLFVLLLIPRTAFAYSGTGVVDCSGYLNMRQSPSTSAKIIDKLYPDTKISIKESSKGWYKISYNGKTGWVSSAYVSTKPPASLKSRSSDVAPSSKGSDLGQEIADYGKKFMGVRYVYGGASPKGFDCSGFTQYVFKNFGIAINRTASTQVKQGTAVKRSDLQKGDLVFFDTNGGHNSISHVGIYLGDGNFINAESGSTRKVTISNLSESYWSRNYMTARRIVK